jgi:hypothetical protein
VKKYGKKEENIKKLCKDENGKGIKIKFENGNNNIGLS